MPLPPRVQEKLNRAFREDDGRRQATDALRSWIESTPSPEAERVALAILKLGEGDLGKLTEAIACARKDPRDVMAWAEYPEEIRLPPDGGAAELDAARARDRAQYLRWLND
jgi:hypothetical protein